MALYKDLNVNRDLVETIIFNNLEGSTCTKKEIGNNGGYVYNYQFEGAKTARIHIYYKSDGTTTIYNDQCKNKSFSNSVVEKIIEKCLIKEFDFNQLYFSRISDTDFDLLFKYISDIGAKIETERELPNGKQYKIKGRLGEELSIIQYNNKSIHFQGKPSLLFNNIVDLLVDIFPPKDVLKGQLGYYNITTPEIEILSELETLYPITGTALSPKLKAIILPSIALKKLSFDLSDYSFMAFPVLRGLEGVLKLIFSNHNITITNVDGFGNFFEINYTTRKFMASDVTTTAIPCAKTCNALADMYNQFNKNRHTLFHVDSLAPRVINQQEAHAIINDTLNIIESSFVSINKL